MFSSTFPFGKPVNLGTAHADLQFRSTHQHLDLLSFLLGSASRVPVHGGVLRAHVIKHIDLRGRELARADALLEEQVELRE